MFLRRPYNIDTAYIGIKIPARRGVAAAQRKFPFSLSYFNMYIYNICMVSESSFDVVVRRRSGEYNNNNNTQGRALTS